MLLPAYHRKAHILLVSFVGQQRVQFFIKHRQGQRASSIQQVEVAGHQRGVREILGDFGSGSYDVDALVEGPFVDDVVDREFIKDLLE